MRISDWSSDVCSSDLPLNETGAPAAARMCRCAPLSFTPDNGKEPAPVGRATMPAWPKSVSTWISPTGPVARAPSGGPRRCRQAQPFLRQSRAHRWERRQPIAKGIEMRQRAQLAVEHGHAGPQDATEEVQSAGAEQTPKVEGTLPQPHGEKSRAVTKYT